MSDIYDYRANFFINCPYCDSRLKIKANHKLKFKTYYFGSDSIIYKYNKVPTWKCSYCRQKFAVDMRNREPYTIESIPEMKSVDYSEVSDEDRDLLVLI